MQPFRSAAQQRRSNRSSMMIEFPDTRLVPSPFREPFYFLLVNRNQDHGSLPQGKSSLFDRYRDHSAFPLKVANQKPIRIESQFAGRRFIGIEWMVH